MRKTILVAAALLLAGCNSQLSKPLPKDLSDPQAAEIGKQLGDQDKRLFVAYLARRELAKTFGTQLADNATTVGEAIEAQRKFEANQTEDEKRTAALKAETLQKRKAVADQINRTVTVALLTSKFLPSDAMRERFDDYEFFDFAVQNLGSQPIKGLKGYAVWTDTFGDEYAKVPMEFEETVGPGEKKTIELSKEINKFMDSDKKIMNLDDTKKFRFEPVQIVFADGSGVKAPEEVE